MMEWLAHKNGEDRFEAHKYPLVAQNLLGVITLRVSDPVIVQDLYTRYNSLTDKRGQAQDLLAPVLGRALLFSKNDEIWKTRRNALKHVFYKDRLSHMLEIFKHTLGKEFEKLKSETDSKGKTVIDISTKFGEVFSSNII